MAVPPLDLSDVATGLGGFVVRGWVPDGRSGLSVGAAGDVNGDGYDDFLIGAPDTGLGGEAYVVFGGAAGFPAELALQDVAAGIGGFVITARSAGDAAGSALTGIGDFNGDGFDDIAIGAPLAGSQEQGEAYVIFGKATFGASVALADVAAGTGGFAITGALPYDRAGSALRNFGDLNGDGLGDIILGTLFADPDRIAAGRIGDTYVILGQATTPTAPMDLADVVPSPDVFVIADLDIATFKGASAALVGDVNGDGYDDLLFGVPGGYGTGGGEALAGDSYLIFGSPAGFESVDLDAVIAGTAGFVIHGPDPGDGSGRSVAGAGDIDGDGYQDLIIGAPGGDGAADGAFAGGDTYIVYGRDFAGTVTHQGTEAGETLTGSAAADVMVGGRGDDVLDGRGGGDALAGGAGSDTLRVGDLSFLRADGGSGTDTLVIEGAGITIDLANRAGETIRGIEVVDITGSGDNRLVLRGADVTRMSGSSNRLRVLGDAGDRLQLGDEPWVDEGSSGGFTTYRLGQAVLEVADAVACFAPGTAIATPAGPVAVERLAAGDAVLLADGSAGRLTWAGAWQADPADPAQRAVRIRAGTFGAGLPGRDLLLSPNHGVWLEGVLVPAASLVDGIRVVREGACRRSYHHIALARHAVLLADGQPVESYLPEAAPEHGGGPVVRDPLPRIEEGMALLRLRRRLGLADAPAGGGRLEGFVERLLPEAGGITVEGWASDGAAPVLLRLAAGGVVRDLPANRWRPDLDRAGLPAAGFRAWLPAAAGTDVRVVRRQDGTELKRLG